ncbi:MAG TPA: hypothetical protein DCE81_05885 [Cytophagales bacterium]|nr:hypothetical protein [Cytophagales bacterium]
MAKTASKAAPVKSESKPARKAAAPKAPKPAKAAAPTLHPIEKAALDAHAKLTSLNLAEDLRSAIEWCVGSYRYDRNPVGLYETVARAVEVFQQEKAKKNKGITAPFIASLEKALATR